ncbi:hypothetical protein QOZ80_2AG0109190 [Eleusine coracana subsp. coracana]|nr:hypothetical protein QOZ80_2AG0109190 [Eleusine coracana subsp. coracana]
MNRQDLLSLLPDCVLGEIVTRLPTRDAVHLQLVSSRYPNAWRASPLNLDVDYRDAVRVLVYLRCHPGPTRRLRLERLSTSYYGDFDHWLLFSPALAGLQALELQLQTLDVSRRPLPPPALRFAATLVLLSFRRVDISEAALHGLLAGCPALQTLVLDECVGFARVRITSASIRSVAVSSSSNLDHATVTRPRQIIIEDAPRLQTVVPFRHRSNNHSDDDESGGGSSCRRSLDLRIVSAPKLRVLGSLSTKTVRKLELGATVFKVIDRIVKHVHGNSASHEKRSEVRAICLATTMPSVKVLALEDVDRMHINDFLRCFPRLERLYLKVS